MGRFSNSLDLAKASWNVLRADKELLIFPIVSAVAAAIVAALFIFPLWVSGYLDGLNDGTASQTLGIVVLFLFYLVLYTVINFCNAALVGAAMIRLRGGDPTAADGFRIASSHIVPIIGWSLIGATIGVVLSVIREKSGMVGDILAGLADAAWGVITFLVVPVLVVEDVGPIEAIKRSTNLLKKTWGEQVIGNAGIGLVVGLAAVGSILFGAMLIAIAASVGIVLLVPVVLLVIVGVALVLAIGSALKGIYTAALYRYAADGEIGAGFDPSLIQNAFVHKR